MKSSRLESTDNLLHNFWVTYSCYEYLEINITSEPDMMDLITSPVITIVISDRLRFLGWDEGLKVFKKYGRF